MSTERYVHRKTQDVSSKNAKNKIFPQKTYPVADISVYM